MPSSQTSTQQFFKDAEHDASPIVLKPKKADKNHKKPVSNRLKRVSARCLH